ncbi:DUF2267 domain-containing protein [Polyangium jinanense]|uniref:DUF2267 domain-containing protein n=1 Tax=Polyangium jinanense TaxID=2829994 RepID=A0A9X3X9L6_9BACT|nr:DUF2267 domain-containing protein [Polyangium jinanense]MDC3960034.1 DUF2267 domain-containing protein [Polyangium jinanense]MDC3986252.1 DUF2267 domain-containing protein [Polyangium jinanense]
MDESSFLDEVAWRGGLGETSLVRAMSEAVLRAFAETLVPDEARALAHALPEPLAAFLLDGPHLGNLSEEALYRRVADREGTLLGFAIEHTRLVLGVLGEKLPETTRLRLRRHLTPELGELLAPREPLPPPPVHLRRPHEPKLGKGNTLATGRPGSQKPLSEARPERAHAESVVRAENPHQETKLSSSCGLTQEREHETLAEGEPGPRRPVSEKGR